MIKKENPIISTASNLVTSVVTMGIGIITGIIVTRALGPEFKGQYSNLKLIASLYSSFLIFGYPGGILFYGIRKEIKLESFFWTGWFFVATMSLVIVAIFLPLVQFGYLGSIAADALEYNIFLGLLGIPFILLNGYSERVIQTYHLFSIANVRIIVGGVVTLFYYLTCLFFGKIELKQALLGIIVGQSVQLLMNLFFVIKYIRVSLSIDWKKMFKPFKYGIKNWLNQILNTSNDKFDQILLTFFLNAGSFGIYTTGVGLSNLLSTVPSSYVNVFYNQIVSKDIDSALLLYAKAQRITFIITVVMSILLSILAYPIIYFMYGAPFLPAALVVILYSPGLIFQVAARLSIKFYAGQGRPLKNSLVYIVGIAISSPFYFILLPRYGINGAAIASSIAYFSSFLFSFYQIHKEYGLKLRDVLSFQKSDFRFILKQFYKLPSVKKYLKIHENE